MKNKQTKQQQNKSKAIKTFCDHQYIVSNFFPTARVLIGYFMTSNNETISHQNVWAGNIAKSFTPEDNSALLHKNSYRRSP